MKSFEEIIGNAQKLMLDEDFNRKVNAKANAFSKNRNGGTPAAQDLRSAAGNLHEKAQLFPGGT